MRSYLFKTLSALFVRRYNGQPRIHRQADASAKRFRRTQLAALGRRGLVTFTEDHWRKAFFGVRGWVVDLTEAGRLEILKALETKRKTKAKRKGK